MGIRLSGCDFADEEKKQLSRYLGSMLRREPTEEEAEQQRVLDWAVDTGFKGKGEVPTSQEKDIQSEDG